MAHNTHTPNAVNPPSGGSLAPARIWSAISASFMRSVGDIVFGMEDGTVSIFGLVFGVAFSTSSGKQVLLAGATGAVAAAVSMMAGSYLDVASKRSIAEYQIAHERSEIQRDLPSELREAAGRLGRAGFDQQEAEEVLAVMRRHPDTLLKFEQAYELHIGGEAAENPYTHAFWMFAADLIAAFTPVLPFAFLALTPARIVSLVVTAVLLLLVGIGRGLVSHRNVFLTAVETLLIATAAAAAGVLLGSAITRWAG